MPTYLSVLFGALSTVMYAVLFAFLMDIFMRRLPWRRRAYLAALFAVTIPGIAVKIYLNVSLGIGYPPPNDLIFGMIVAAVKFAIIALPITFFFTAWRVDKRSTRSNAETFE